jgi:hypothetical protein
MVQTPTEQSPNVVCEACKKPYDVTSWRSLALICGGAAGRTVNGREVATHLAQTRRCTCGQNISIQFALPSGTTPQQADVIHAAALLGT